MATVAESDPKHQIQTEEEVEVRKGDEEQEEEEGMGVNLKYLEWVQVAAVQAVVLMSTIYGFAKQNSGPLKPGVHTVEGTVRTVIGPVYNKFRHLPFQLLFFADRRVDRFVEEVERHVPGVVKAASRLLYTAAHKAPELARSMSSEVKRVGVVEAAREAYTTMEPKAKQLCLKYESLVEQQALVAWRRLNRLPLLPELVHIMVPTASYWAGKYNATVRCLTRSGYTLSQYLPLVPTDRIAKAFSDDHHEHDVDAESKSKLNNNSSDEHLTASDGSGIVAAH